MSRASESVTRVDVRFSNEMYDAIQQLAIQNGARTHHISQKVEVSPTIIKLVQLALDTLGGKVSDNSNNFADRFIEALPDKVKTVSDISDTRIEAIVNRRLAELGLFPVCQIESDCTHHCLPDKGGTIPDSLPDKDDIISDRVIILPDKLPDTINIPSADDSINSESIADDVQVSGEASTSFSFAEFHQWLGLPKTARNKANGDTAIEFARSQGKGGWVMSKSYKLTKLTEDN